MILGHEGCAEVVEVGSEVKDFKDGLDAEINACSSDRTLKRKSSASAWERCLGKRKYPLLGSI